MTQLHMFIISKEIFYLLIQYLLELPQRLRGKASTRNAGASGDMGSIPGSEEYPGGGHGYPPIFLPGESYKKRSLVHYSP